MLESYWNLVKNTGRFWLDGNMRLQVQASAPATPPADNYEFYAKSTGLFIKNSSGTEVGPLSTGVTDHGALTGLGDDDHTIYALLLGRSGGQTLIGGTAASNNLILRSTSNATRGGIIHGETPASIGSIHPSITAGYHQWYVNSTSQGPELQMVNLATASGSSLGALSWGSKGASASDKRGALIHTALDGAGGTNPTSRMEFYVNNAGSFVQAMTIKSDGKIGFITATPTFQMELATDAPLAMALRNAGSGGAYAFHFLRSRNTIASPQATQASDSLGSLNWGGYQGGSWAEARARIIGFAGSLWSGSNQETYLTIQTTPSGSTTPSERMRITSSGQVGIGVTPSSALLHIGADNQAALQIDGLVTAFAPTIMGRGYRTSLASPAAVQTNDTLAHFTGAGRGATGYSAGKASMVCSAAENWSDSAQGTYITFQTTPTGSTTRAERLRVEASGDISHASDVRHRMLSQNRFRYLNSTASAYRNTNQTLSNNTNTAISFAHEQFDTDAIHDNSTNPTRMIAKIAGKFLVTCSLRFDGNATGARVVTVQANGATLLSQNGSKDVDGNHVIVTGSPVVASLAANEYIEVIGFQDSGGNLDVVGDTRNHVTLTYLGE